MGLLQPQPHELRQDNDKLYSVVQLKTVDLADATTECAAVMLTDAIKSFLH